VLPDRARHRDRAQVRVRRSRVRWAGEGRGVDGALLEQPGPLDRHRGESHLPGAEFDHAFLLEAAGVGARAEGAGLGAPPSQRRPFRGDRIVEDGEAIGDLLQPGA
jgi:hypothetical protein